MNYPKRIIAKGETSKSIVKAIQNQLNAKGCGPVAVDGDFGNQTASAVKLFQSRNSDQNGNPLLADGKIGPVTWAILFGADSVPVADTSNSPLLSKVLEVAASQIGVIEQPPFSNRGPEIDNYLRTVGLNPAADSYPWCAAFVYWCFNTAAAQLGRSNPLYKTAGVLEHWRNAKGALLLKDDAVANPAKIKPGFIFIIDHGGGNGHTGLVESVNGGFITTIEGNTNNDGSRNGYGVLRLTNRKINAITKGFIDYSKK